MVFRIDRGSLRPPEILPGGRLRVDAYLTRTGVFIYRNPDGTEFRELRPAEEVFHGDSMNSFVLAPLTDDHPMEAVTPANAKEHAVGSVGESIRRDGDYLAASLVVWHEATIAAMREGKREVSCGYSCDLEMTPGEYNGERYDAIQRNIRGNHVAIVDVGRAGSDVRVRMDAAVMVDVSGDAAGTNIVAGSDAGESQRQNSAAERSDSMDWEKLYKEAVAEKAAEKVRADNAERERDEQKARADKAEARRNDSETEIVAASRKERDAANARADGLEVELRNAKRAREDAEKAMSQRVRERVALESKAREILGEDQDVSTMADRDLKTAVIVKVDGEDAGVDSSKSDDYVTARYDSAVARAVSAEKQFVIRHGGGHSDSGDEAAARQRMIERGSIAWKGQK